MRAFEEHAGEEPSGALRDRPDAARAASPATDLARITALQRSAGNRAVAALVDRDRHAAPVAVQRHTGPSVLQPVGESATVDGAATTGGEGLGTTSAGGAETEVAATESAGTGAAPKRPGVLGRIGGALRGAARAVQASSAAKKAGIYARLALTSEGRHALWILLRYRVKVDVAGTQPGSYFTSSDNTVYLNAGETTPSAAIILVHEAGHAETFHRVGDPDVMSLTRAAYVKTLIEDEARAVVRQIRVIGELQSIRFDATNTSVGDADAKAYWKAHHDAMAAAPAGTSPSDKQKLGEKAGFDRVFTMFYDGTFVTSTTGQAYADYYGSFWDTCHTPGAGGGG